MTEQERMELAHIRKHVDRAAERHIRLWDRRTQKHGGTLDPKIELRYLLGDRRKRLARYRRLNAPTLILLHNEQQMTELLFRMAEVFPRQEKSYRRKAWQHARKAVEMMSAMATEDPTREAK